MLCQLSYRGSAAAIVARLTERRNLDPKPLDLVEKLAFPVAVGVLKLSPQSTLAQAHDHLPRGVLGDAVGVAERVELGEQRVDVAVRRLLSEQERTHATVQLVVEELGRELLELGAERLVRGDARERAALEPLACIEEPGRDDAGGARATPRRRKAGLHLRRQIEEVGRNADCLEVVGLLGQRGEEGTDRR